MSPTKEINLVGKILRGLGKFCFRYPWPIVVASVAVAVASVWYTAHGLVLHTDRSELISPTSKHNQRFLKFVQEFGRQGDIIVVVESDRAEKSRQIVEAMVQRLKAEPTLFTGVLYKFDLSFFGKDALQFIPEDELRSLTEALHEFRPSLAKFIGSNDFPSLFRSINREFLSGGGNETEGKRLLKSLPALRRIVDQVSQSLTAQDPSVAPEIAMLMDEPEVVLRDLYVTRNRGKIFLVSVKWQPQKSDLTPGAAAIKRLTAIKEALKKDYPGLNIGITGDPVLEYDEMKSAASSMNWASLVSLVLVSGMFIFSYREFLHPIKAVITLLVAVAWTFGFTTLAIGHLNILTITFVPILIGLGVDHGIHIISRYEEELARGAEREEAMEISMAQTGVGVWTGALTMAGAFLAIMLTDFRGIREMGLITGAGVLLSCVAMMTTLPALLALEHGATQRRRLQARTEPLGRSRALIEQEFLKYPMATLAVAVGLTLLGGYFLKNIYFDYNLLHLQSPELESVQYERKLIDFADHSILNAATDCATLGEARELAKAFAEKIDIVDEVHTVGDLFDGNPAEKLRLIRAVKTDLSGLNFGAPTTEAVDVDELSRRLVTLNTLLGLAQKDLHDAGELEAEREAKRLIESLDKLLVQLRTLDPAQVREKLTVFQQAFFNHLRSTLELIRQQDGSRAVAVADVPPLVREQLVGQTGRFMVQIYPKEDIWEMEALRKFVKGLQKVRNDVTGPPVTNYVYINELRRSYERAAGYALAAVIVLVFLHFRSWRAVLLSLVPLAAGVCWMLGVMGVGNMPFNPANIMTLPLVLGIGVVNGIQMLHRAKEEKTPALFSKSTGKAVLLTSLTTLAGFGSLMIASHPGIASLGKIMSIGLITCLVSSVVLVPALLALGQKKGWKI